MSPRDMHRRYHSVEGQLEDIVWMLDQEPCKWQTNNALQSATCVFAQCVLSDGSLIKIRVGHEDCWIIM